MPRNPQSGTIHQIKVTLKGSRPPIWRRLQVPSDITLSRLHRVLQVVMGWEDDHLHRFRVGNTAYGEPNPDYGTDYRDERRARLAQVAPGEKSRFLYTYDFGDGWEHQILVEKVLPADPSTEYPLCLKGQLSGPPEDSGGAWGYAALLDAYQDPNNEDHEDAVEWLGEDFDPEAFDLEGVNRALRSLR